MLSEFWSILAVVVAGCLSFSGWPLLSKALGNKSCTLPGTFVNMVVLYYQSCDLNNNPAGPSNRAEYHEKIFSGCCRLFIVLNSF